MIDYVRIMSDVIAHSKKNKAAFARSIGAEPTQVYDILSGKTKSITESFARKIVDNYKEIRLSWLLTGEGSMLVSSSHVENPTSHEKKSPSHADESTKEGEKGLKYYYEMDATAGDIEDLTDNEIGQPYRILTIPGYEGCTAFNVRGESMLNVAKPGDIVAVEPNPADIVVNGEIYLVVTKDGQRMIKRCIHLPDTQQLRCISDTPRIELFPPTDIATERVHRIFRVRGFVSLSLLN